MSAPSPRKRPKRDKTPRRLVEDRIEACPYCGGWAISSGNYRYSRIHCIHCTNLLKRYFDNEGNPL